MWYVHNSITDQQLYVIICWGWGIPIVDVLGDVVLHVDNL